MSVFVNDRDIILQATVPRNINPTLGKLLLLTSDTPVFKEAAGVGAPVLATLTAQLFGLTGTATWAITGGTLSGTAANVRTLTYAAMSGPVAVITATVVDAGITYIASTIIVKVADGVTSYTWIKYGTSAAGAGLSDSPDGMTYLGLAYNKLTPVESTTASDYSWSLMTGTDGIPGAPGPTGATTYTWVKYSDVADGTGLYDTPVAATLYIGIAVNKPTATESTLKTDYTWSKFRGDQGVAGPAGAAGAAGSAGQRGTVMIASDAYGTAWTDAHAVAALAAAGYSPPVDRDVVTLFGGTTSTTKFFQSGAWYVLSAYIHGNMIVSGTFSADAIYGGLLSGVRIGIGSGGTPGGYSFEVNSSGQPWFTSIISGGSSVFTNAGASSFSPITADVFGSSIAAIYGRAPALGGAGAHGLRGTNMSNGASGIVGGANGYCFYAEGPGTNYGPFTGAHDVLIPIDANIAIGDIVVDVVCKGRNGLSNTIFEVAVSSAPCQKGAVGVLVWLAGPLASVKPAAFVVERYHGVDPAGDGTYNEVVSPEYDAARDFYSVGAANALGEGQMNVCGEGGDINLGDLIVTSSIPGKGMRQADDLVRSYTVARAREAMIFSSPSEIKLIACFYTP